MYRKGYIFCHKWEYNIQSRKGMRRINSSIRMHIQISLEEELKLIKCIQISVKNLLVQRRRSELDHRTS
jgi:hypothetical protein